MAFWLLKSEPNVWSFQQQYHKKPHSEPWDGIRNYRARNNLARMKKGEKAFFYHSNIGMEIVGVVEITREAYVDETANDPRWLCVDVCACYPLEKPIPLKAIKDNKNLQNMELVRFSRLSVQEVLEKEWIEIHKMAATTL